MLATSNVMMKRMHGRRTSNRFKSFDNINMTIMILKPKVVKLKNRILRRHARVGYKQERKVIRASSRKILVHYRSKKSHPVMVCKESVKTCPTARQTSLVITPSKVRSYKTNIHKIIAINKSVKETGLISVRSGTSPFEVLIRKD